MARDSAKNIPYGIHGMEGGIHPFHMEYTGECKDLIPSLFSPFPYSLPSLILSLPPPSLPPLPLTFTVVKSMYVVIFNTMSFSVSVQMYML
jgi:hypothetical protein